MDFLKKMSNNSKKKKKDNQVTEVLDYTNTDEPEKEVFISAKKGFYPNGYSFYKDPDFSSKERTQYTLKGVTTGNRQHTLKSIYNNTTPFNEPYKVNLRQYEFESKPAIEVMINELSLGTINASYVKILNDDIPSLTNSFIYVYGGSEGKSYGCKLITFK
ncbi:MAG: hypothetical protein JJE03_07305 [Peptostreptococcaceae bacterium]|nr:hypothetical protein [Peptostreptococcaceae bacterium]